MTELKITIGQLKNYLGTDVTFIPNEFPDAELPLESLNSDAVMGSDQDGNEGEFYYQDVKLKCYRLSDLDKHIPELGFVPIDKLGEDDWNIYVRHILFAGRFDKTPFSAMQSIFQWHFWPFGDEYFEAGLVIDKLKHNAIT